MSFNNWSFFNLNWSLRTLNRARSVRIRYQGILEMWDRVCRCYQMHRFWNFDRIRLHFFLWFLVNSVLNRMQWALWVALAKHRLLLVIFIYDDTWDLIDNWSINLFIALFKIWVTCAVDVPCILIGPWERLCWWLLRLLILAWFKWVIYLLGHWLLDILITDDAFYAVVTHVWKHVTLWLFFVQ